MLSKINFVACLLSKSSVTDTFSGTRSAK